MAASPSPRKTQGFDVIQLVRFGDLARRMPFHRHREFVERNAHAVIRDENRTGQPSGHLDRDARRTRIEGVLDQFLHHGGRAFHDLARGDPSYQGIREGPGSETVLPTRGLPVHGRANPMEAQRPPWILLAHD